MARKDREEISVLSALEQDVLTALHAAQRELYGLEIKEALEEVSQGKRELSFGSLYPALHKLEEKKLIKARRGNEETGTQRKYYAIQRLGEELLKEINNYRGRLKNFFDELGDDEAAAKSQESLNVIEKLVLESTMSSITEVIGFDLGDGDTAIAKLSISNDSDPKMLDLFEQKKQVTAIGRDSAGNTYIGEQAVTFDGVTRLHISFKEKPNLSSSYPEALLKSYMTQYYHLLKDKRQIEGGTCSHFVVGCPSGWETEAREKYQKILKIDEICSLTVEPESRAAFLHAKDSGKFTVTELLSPVLIIDIGSSTTDFTLVKNLQTKLIDFGENQLGACLIDKSILKFSLNNQKRKKEVEAAFEQDKSLPEKCELACRKAKEIYFSQEKTYNKEPQKRIKTADYPINEEEEDYLYFRPMVTAEYIQEILNERQAQLGDKSWRKAFEDKIREVSEELAEKKISLRVLLMTGGASRMQFTRDICQSTFPEVKFEPDIEPEFSIAAGLARIGKWDLLSKGFKREVKELIEKGEVRDVIRSYIPELIDLIVELLKEGIVGLVKADLKAWQEGKISTLKKVEEDIKPRIDEWLKNSDIKHRIQDKCKTWLQNPAILRELDKKTQPICEKFRMPESGLNLQANIDPEIKRPAIPLQEVIGIEPFKRIADVIARTVEHILRAGGMLGAVILLVTGSWLLAIAAGIVAKLAPEAADAIQQYLQKRITNNEQVLKRLLVSTDIPVNFSGFMLREMILPNDKIDTLCQEKEANLAKELSEKMKESQHLFEDVVEKVGEALENALFLRAEQAVILIK